MTTLRNTCTLFARRLRANAAAAERQRFSVASLGTLRIEECAALAEVLEAEAGRTLRREAALFTALLEEGSREDLLAHVARLTSERDNRAALRQENERLRQIVASFIALIEDSMTDLAHPDVGRFVAGVTDLELRPDGSLRLSDARAALATPPAALAGPDDDADEAYEIGKLFVQFSDEREG